MNQLYSAVIIAKNEERTIGDVINALLQLTDDIIVVLDDRSIDGTHKIAKELGAQVYVKTWEGYSANKNFGVSKAHHDWILCPDADEVFDDTLIHYLQRLIPDISRVYEMNRQTYFCGYAVKYCGWFPDWVVRLYHKDMLNWNASLVHEKLETKHNISHTKVPGLIKHFSFANESEMQSKFDYYARLRADEWTNSQKKPSKLKQWFGPYFRFLRTFILKLGILDGKYGFIIAKNELILKQKELKYWKSQKNGY